MSLSFFIKDGKTQECEDLKSGDLPGDDALQPTRNREVLGHVTGSVCLYRLNLKILS
ncbi:hypothetical protein GCM10010954_10160 [Halobacillus andaensis]|uniref:Uncharacterized protein n=1 Tax=Halobacillus andaensis TaxID=1176239 RepID=A0A917B198_HALAA|nr:hypothetical protein GCM10010954_10160 [Halobacillus andaensis]